MRTRHLINKKIKRWKMNVKVKKRLFFFHLNFWKSTKMFSSKLKKCIIKRKKYDPLFFLFLEWVIINRNYSTFCQFCFFLELKLIKLIYEVLMSRNFQISTFDNNCWSDMTSSIIHHAYGTFRDTFHCFRVWSVETMVEERKPKKVKL